MHRQLKGIALILFAILMTIQYGHKAIGDLDFGWSLVFHLMGLAGVVLVFWPMKKKKN